MGLHDAVYFQQEQKQKGRGQLEREGNGRGTGDDEVESQPMEKDLLMFTVVHLEISLEIQRPTAQRQNTTTWRTIQINQFKVWSEWSQGKAKLHQTQTAFVMHTLQGDFFVYTVYWLVFHAISHGLHLKGFYTDQSKCKSRGRRQLSLVSHRNSCPITVRNYRNGHMQKSHNVISWFRDCPSIIHSLSMPSANDSPKEPKFITGSQLREQMVYTLKTLLIWSSQTRPQLCGLVKPYHRHGLVQPYHSHMI